MLFERKRVLGLVLALVLVFSLAACTTDQPAEPNGGVEQPVEVSVVEEAATAYFADLPKINFPHADFVQKVKDGEELFIIDIRKADDYAAGHVVGAVNAPWSTQVLAENLASIPMDEPIYVYCYSGQTAGQTTALLNIAGFDAKSVTYGYSKGITQVEGYEEIVSTEAVEFDEPIGTEVAPEIQTLISEYFADLPTNTYPNNLIPAADLNALIEAEDDSIFVVSIRQPEDFEAGHIPTAINIPFGAGMQENFDQLPMDKTVVIYCYSGQTAGQTVGGLRALGYDAVSSVSGFGTPKTMESGWSLEGFDVVQ